MSVRPLSHNKLNVPKHVDVKLKRRKHKQQDRVNHLDCVVAGLLGFGSSFHIGSTVLVEYKRFLFGSWFACSGWFLIMAPPNSQIIVQSPTQGPNVVLYSGLPVIEWLMGVGCLSVDFFCVLVCFAGQP